MIDSLKQTFFKNIKYLFLVIGILLLNSGNAQNIEELYITVQPYTALMKINNKVISLTKEDQPKIINLPHGTYPIEVWAPGFETYIDTIKIRGDFVNKYSRLLTVKTEKFKEFENQTVLFKKAKKSRKRKKIGLIALNALLTYYVVDGERFRINNLRNKTDIALLEYNAAITTADLDMKFDNYTIAQENHNDAVKFGKTKLLVGIPVLIGAYIGTWFQFKKINKKSIQEEPIFQPEAPFTKLNLKLGIDAFEGGYGLGLTLTF